jgi:hypothetical protein
MAAPRAPQHTADPQQLQIVVAQQRRTVHKVERIVDVTPLDRERIIPALGWRAYHLPGNTWMEDYCQYLANNHPLFGICCHHPLHPVKFSHRILNLTGSIVFGLAVTNIIWLWLILDQNLDEEHTIITVSTTGITTNFTEIEALQDRPNVNDAVLNITEGMILLWTIGGGLHALYDNTIWYMTACVCCLPGQRLECLYRYRWCGTYFVVLTVIVSTAIATFVVVLRASLNEQEESDATIVQSSGLINNSIQVRYVHDKSAYEFLISYVVELALALFVYYPVIATVLFTGILGCGTVPILGGRPYEVKQEKRLEQQRASSVNPW